MESEQLQEDSSTLLDWILKLCPRDHQIIPLILSTADFVPFLSRLISDVGKSKMQVKRKTLNSEETTSTPALALVPMVQPSGALTRGEDITALPMAECLSSTMLEEPKVTNSFRV